MGTSSLPEELNSYLILCVDPAGLPICRGCEAALLPKSVLDHLRKHHQLPAGLRASVKSLVASLPNLDFGDVANRPNGSSPLQEVRIVDAYQCEHCHFIRRDLTDVRKHINQVHGLSATGGYCKIKAQSWFGGRRASYWQVCVEKDDRDEPDIPKCVWGFYGKGFGERTPKKWPKVAAEEANTSSEFFF